MSMGFRLGRCKKIFIILLLILSIIVQQFVCPALIRATELDDGFYATYWDLFNSIASEMGYSMSEIKEDHNVSRPDVMDRANVNFLKFMDWLGQTPSINHSGGGHDIEDDSSGDHSGGGTSIREDTEVYIEEAKNLMQNATTKGIKMSQGLWDAFKQFFSDVENDKECNSSFVPDLSYSSELLNNYIRQVTGLDTSGVSESYVSYFLNKNICIIEGSIVGNYKYYCIASSKSDGGVWHSDKSLYDDKVLCWTDLDEDYYFYNIPYNGVGGGYYGRFGEGMLHAERIIAVNWMIPSTVKDLYSPYIKYTPIGTAPAQVPDIIPWSTFPDHEVTDDDTKIYIPVESPGEETPTETPEDPTETPEDPNDGDDIFDFDPIFPDIDIDPDIELPDDWINPPDIDIDLDPDVDVDTPSPGGKIPHLQKLKEKFPFCIPFDLVLLFKMLNKKPKAPKWEFKHDFQIGDSKPYTWEVVVDMADYDKYVQIFREGFFLLFLVGLFFVTKKLISWQTG